MPYDPARHHRRSVRLHGWNYAWVGSYFITLCAFRRECLFGEIVDGRMRLNDYGQVVTEEWARSSTLRAEIEPDVFVVMPNHFHAIVHLIPAGGDQPVAPTESHEKAADAQVSGPRPRSISSLVAGFKAAVTTRINGLRDSPHAPVWQRSFHDHVIRSEEALQRIREYVVNNPFLWLDDRYHPDRPSPDL